MSKHRHQDKSEQINERIKDTAQLRQDKIIYQKNEILKAKVIQKKAAVDDRLIRQRAYEIYSKQGGQALDNWLEAERFLKKGDLKVDSFINEGNPNTQA